MSKADLVNIHYSGSADSNVLDYRPDVDGLRAIAVVSVIAFHLSSNFLPGGYFGVDMFFVLSGYLITAIIWREAMGSGFSIGRFYDRRIRRIMPSLVMVLFATSVAATAILLPADLIGYGKSLLATLVFSANIYFWRDTNYFSRIAEEKPLLHLWSLGVEEQFYILFPLILVVVARYRSSLALPTVGAICAISLACYTLLINAGGSAPAFFLLPPRAWELGIGAMLALAPRKFANVRLAVAASVTGAILVTLGMITPLPHSTVVPPATPVVIGTALLIWAGNIRLVAVNRFLAVQPIVFVGLISYSLYLWHWPIIVFARYYLVREINTLEMIVALVAMFALATLSWRYAERPFRSKNMPFRSVGLAMGASTALLCVVGIHAILSDGLPGRLSARAAVINEAVGTHYRCPVTQYLSFGLMRACTLNLPSRDPDDAELVLLGNSHAQMYAPAWEKLIAARELHGLLVPLNACTPTVTVNISENCLKAARRNLDELLKLDRARIVVLGLTWNQGPDGLIDENGEPVDNSGSKALVAGLDDLIGRLDRNGKTVILTGPIAAPGADIASTLSRELAFGHPPSLPEAEPASAFLEKYQLAFRHFSGRDDVIFVRPDKVQCDGENCNYLLDGRSLFSDDHHIAAAELFRFEDMLTSALDDALTLESR